MYLSGSVVMCANDHLGKSCCVAPRRVRRVCVLTRLLLLQMDSPPLDSFNSGCPGFNYSDALGSPNVFQQGDSPAPATPASPARSATPASPHSRSETPTRTAKRSRDVPSPAGSLLGSSSSGSPVRRSPRLSGGAIPSSGELCENSSVRCLSRVASCEF